MFYTMEDGFSGSTKVVRILFLAKFCDSFKAFVLPKVLRQGIALPIPHIEIYSGVTAIIS